MISQIFKKPDQKTRPPELQISHAAYDRATARLLIHREMDRGLNSRLSFFLATAVICESLIIGILYVEQGGTN